MLIISKQNETLLFTCDKSLLQYMPFLKDTALSFSYLLNRVETISGKDFSERISEGYSIDNPKVKIAIDILNGELKLSKYYPMYLYN